MTCRKPFIIGCDIDGVLLDTQGAFLRFVNQLFNTDIRFEDWTDFHFSKVVDLPLQEIVNYWDQFYASVDITMLAPLPWVYDVVLPFRESGLIDPVAITGRPDHIIDRTYTCIEALLPRCPIHFTNAINNNYAGGNGRKSKQEIAESVGAICMIDDNPHEFSEWTSETVKPICFARPWNRDHTPPGIERMDGDQIRAFLLQATS